MEKPICYQWLRQIRWKERLEYLRIDDEYFPFRDSNLAVSELIGVSISKPSIEWVVIRRKQCSNILSNTKENIKDSDMPEIVRHKYDYSTNSRI